MAPRHFLLISPLSIAADRKSRPTRRTDVTLVRWRRDPWVAGMALRRFLAGWEGLVAPELAYFWRSAPRGN